jgi:hypothetical protein
MSNDYDDDDFGTDIPDLRKAHKASQRRVKELEQELTDLRKQGRDRSVKDVLAQRGINTKIAALIPTDVSDEAGVSAWLDEFSDVFGITSDAGSGDSGDANTPPAPGTPAGMSAADVQAFADINQAGSGRPIEAESDLFARIQAAQTPDELTALLRSV